MKNIKAFLVKNREEFEGLAGMLMLAAIAMSTSIGMFPALLLIFAGILRIVAELGADRPKFMETISVAAILALPSVDFFLGREAKYVLAFVALVLVIANFLRKNNENSERY